MEHKDSVHKKGVYWYFRFTDRFFDDLEILRLQNLPGNAGYEYIVILLKLYCLSTSTAGCIKIRTSYTGGIDFRLIADAIHHKDVETVKVAIMYFIEVGLLQIVESVDYTTFFAPQVQNNIGRASEDADRKRRERNLKSESESEQKASLPTQSNVLPTSKEKTYKYGLTRNIELSPAEVQRLSNVYENASAIVNEASNLKEIKSNKVNGKSDIEIIREIAQKLGVKRENEVSESDVPTGIFNNVKISKAEWERLCKEFADPRGLVDYISQRIYAANYKMSSDFAFALKVGHEDGWQTLGEKLREEEEKKEAQAAEAEKKKERRYKQYLNEAKIGVRPSKEVLELLGEDVYQELMKIAEDAYEEQTGIRITAEDSREMTDEEREVYIKKMRDILTGNNRG